MALVEKPKQVAVSNKRQITIPKKFYDEYGFGDRVLIEPHGNHLVIKPLTEGFTDFSQEILADIIEDGFKDPKEIQAEFAHRKEQMGRAVRSLVNDAKKNGEKMTVDELFREDDDE